MESSPIEVAVEGGVATVTINRPERKNALSVDAANGLVDAWERIEADDTVRVAILTSADCGVFSAGLDLKEAAEIARTESVDILSKMRDPFHDTMRGCRKPIIAAINGDALGGGLELALASDIRLASAKARFGLPEVCVGVIAGGGGVTRLPRLLPPSLAAQMLLAGDMIDAETALVSGLVSRVYPNPAELIEAALDTAERIASNAPLAVERTLSLIRQSRSLSLAEALEAERAAFRDILATADSVEGIAAFAERRPADFKGV